MRLVDEMYNDIFGYRCDTRPGLKYFTEKDYDGLIKENFEFKNDNGFILRGGYYHYAMYDKDTIVVFCHGMGGGHQAYMQEINYLAKNGFLVLSIDYQGTILSEGNKLGGPSQPLKDMDKCISLIKDKYKHIYVFGHSWGGWVAQGLTALHPEIEKLVMNAGLCSLKALIKQFLKSYLILYRNSFLDLEKDKYGDLALSDASINLNRSDLKAMVLQSKDDQILDIKNNLYVMQSKCTNPNVEFIIVDHKSHNPCYTIDACAKLNAHFAKLEKCKSKDDAIKLANETNWWELCDLDTEIMDKIIKFLKN